MTGQLNPIKYHDIRAYAADHGLPLDDAVVILQAMDDALFAVHAEAAARRDQQRQRATP